MAPLMRHSRCWKIQTRGNRLSVAASKNLACDARYCTVWTNVGTPMQLADLPAWYGTASTIRSLPSSVTRHCDVIAYLQSHEINGSTAQPCRASIYNSKKRHQAASCISARVWGMQSVFVDLPLCVLVETRPVILLMRVSTSIVSCRTPPRFDTFLTFFQHLLIPSD